MKSFYYSLVLLLFLASAGTVCAAKQSATHLALVVAVDAKTITIQTRPKPGSKVSNIDNDGHVTKKAPNNIVIYNVTPMTEIVVDGLPSKLSDLQVGMNATITVGMNRADAARVVANTVPPPVATPTPGKGNQIFPKISQQQVLAIQPDRITIGAYGTSKATAYFITKRTVIAIDGLAGTTAGIGVGRPVRVVAADQTTAASIQVGDTPSDAN